jgi:hypothetical protein
MKGKKSFNGRKKNLRGAVGRQGFHQSGIGIALIGEMLVWIIRSHKYKNKPSFPKMQLPALTDDSLLPDSRQYTIPSSRVL